MNKYLYILFFSFLSLLLSFEDCDIIIEDVREFNRAQKKDADNKVNLSQEEYLDRIDHYNELLNQIYNSDDCSRYRQDSINVNLKFSYGTFTVKRSGDITSYKKILTSSLWIIKERIQKNLRLYIRGKETMPNNYMSGFKKDEGWKNDIKEYNLLFDNYYSQLDSEFENLNKLYKDLNIYITSDETFNEMQQIYSTVTNEAMYLSIEPPPIYYKKDKYKKKYPDQLSRMDFLKQEIIPIKLTSYNKNKGFYMTVPMVPIVQEKRKVDPEYTYAISIKGSKKIRFQFSKIKIEDISLNINEINAIAKEQVPNNWSKIALSEDFSWSYHDSQSGNQVASFNLKDGMKIAPGFENEFIAVKNNEEFIIYQRKNVEQANYRLVLNQNEKKFPSWAKYFLFVALFGGGYAQ